jgi:hypothetical protein
MQRVGGELRGLMWCLFLFVYGVFSLAALGLSGGAKQVHTHIPLQPVDHHTPAPAPPVNPKVRERKSVGVSLLLVLTVKCGGVFRACIRRR